MIFRNCIWSSAVSIFVCGVFAESSRLWANCPESFSPAALVKRLSQLPSDQVFLGWRLEDRRSAMERELEKDPLAFYDESLDTMIRTAKGGRFVLPDGAVADFNMPLVSGFGSSRSGSKGMRPVLDLLSAHKAKPSKNGERSLTSIVRESGIQLVVEAPEFPTHEFGPPSASVETLNEVLDWMHRYFQSIREQSGRPLVPLVRSAAFGLMMAYHQSFPGELAGLIAISPTHSRVGFRDSEQALLESAQSGAPVQIHVESLLWISRIYSQMNWQEEPDPLQGLPLLILNSEVGLDPQMSSAARAEFRRLASMSSLGRYREIAGAGHDVLRFSSDRRVLVSAYEEIFDFLDHLKASRQ